MWMEAVILFRCVKLVIGHVRTATNSFQKMVQRLLQHIKQTLIFFKGKKVVQKKKKSLLSKMKKQVDISSSIIYSGEYCLCWWPDSIHDSEIIHDNQTQKDAMHNCPYAILNRSLLTTKSKGAFWCEELPPYSCHLTILNHEPSWHKRMPHSVRNFQLHLLHVRLRFWIMNLRDMKGCISMRGGEAVSCRAATEAGASRRFSSEQIGTQSSEKTIWR